ncbi:MAG: hypothetical protein K6G10_00200, partial [Butyrivibrio sp.]|nr:hypothetical protein [Butyrivibrio sp.]
MTNNTSKGWLIGLEKKKTRMLALILALIVVFTNTDLTVLAEGPEDNPGYTGASSSEDRFEEDSEEDDDEDEESLDTKETEEENDGDDGNKNGNEEETTEEDEETQDTEDTLEPEEIEDAELIEEEEILAATGDEPEVQYTLIVNTSTDSISLDPGESCNIPYGESVSFSAKVTTTGEETQVETFDSGVSVIYATSVSGLESYTPWPGTP